MGDRRRHRHLAADPRRQVPGRGRRREHPRRAARGQLRGGAARRLHRPAGGGGRRDRGAASARTAPLSEVAKTETYTRAYAETNGFLTLLSDGERLTGAYALGPEAGEWLQQATLAIRARVPLDVLRDTIQPFPTFSEIYVAALKALHGEIKARQGLMPWFPEFTTAVELARRETQLAGRADPVKQYFAALNEGDAGALESVWPGEVVVHDPVAGEIRGHKHLRQFVSHNHSWLTRAACPIETVASTVDNGRAVVELRRHRSRCMPSRRETGCCFRLTSAPA